MQMNKKQLRRETIIVFFLCLLLMIAVFAIMLPNRISQDGYCDFFSVQSFENARWKLSLGRPGGAVAEALLRLADINPVAVQLPFTLALIVIIAWCCADL